jgi:hypothetical protein
MTSEGEIFNPPAELQPVDALRGTIDRNRKTEKKELCQHIP